MHPTILEADGKPAFVVLTYAEYLNLTEPRVPRDDSIPHEVIDLMARNDWSIVRSWREYLGLTQVDMATRLSIRQPTYVAMESPQAKPRRSTRERLAAALGVSVEQISV